MTDRRWPGDGDLCDVDLKGLKNRMPRRAKQPLMRSLGEFVGHIVKAVRSDPSRRTIRKTVEQEQRGDITLRRTTIEEVEIHRSGDRQPR